MSADLGDALTDGLAALSRVEEVGPPLAPQREPGGLKPLCFLLPPVQTRRVSGQLPAAVGRSRQGARRRRLSRPGGRQPRSRAGSRSPGVPGVEGRGCPGAAAQREGLPAEAGCRAEGGSSSHLRLAPGAGARRPVWFLSSQAYLEPLNAALDSGRTILSSSELHLILAPVASILELNR